MIHLIKISSSTFDGEQSLFLVIKSLNSIIIANHL